MAQQTESDLSYGYKKKVEAPYEQTVERVKQELKQEGFGVLTEINVQSALKEKLGVDFRRYLILGACNPQLAYQALEQEPDRGLLLPCNVVVYEENGGTVVDVVRPLQMVETTGNAELRPIARHADEKLRAALDRVH